MNLLGEPVDGGGPITAAKRLPIHRPTPAFTDQSTQTSEDVRQSYFCFFHAS